MMNKSKLVKGKVIAGYIILFIIGVAAGTFFYYQILKITQSKNEVSKSGQLIELSDALATLYAAESTGLNSELIISEKGFAQYNQMIDTVISRMNHLKERGNSSYETKLDSITIFLERKKSSVAKIRVLNQQYATEASFANAKRRLEKAIDSLKESKTIQYPKTIRSIEFENLVSDFLTQEQIENLNRLPISDTELLTHYQKTLSELSVHEDKLRREMSLRERELQSENFILTGKIQLLLSNIEEEILDQSYAEIADNQKEIEHTSLVLLWMGISGLLLVLLFGWIILRDLTRQQNYRNKLEKLNQENSTLLRSKTMLIATVTHDLQTPLGSILGFSDLLKNTPLDSTQKEYVNNISSSSDYILNLVNDLVDFSKLENNKIKIRKTSFNPKQLIINLFDTLKQNATDKDITLLYEVDEGLDINIISDSYRLKQILTNLITNAIKFTPEGSVRISGKITDGSVCFEVSDTGIGISDEQQLLIFEEFTQAHPDIEKRFGGTGLGLTISKRFTELLGGFILVESKLGKGSVFSVSIPLIISDSADLEQKVSYNTDFLQNKKILIIDDDKMQLSLMEVVFSNYPVKIHTLYDATKVIPLLKKESFDIVLTDIQMPKKSGFMLIEKIRNHPEKAIREIPVIALSGKRDSSPEDYIEKGFTYFLGKPLQMNEALHILELVLNGKVNQPKRVINSIQKSDKAYNLNSLNQFLDDDKPALKNILTVLINSLQTSIQELQNHPENIDKLSQIAHRMIPMLRQIESMVIVELLEELEDKKIPTSKTHQHIDEIFQRLTKLITALENHINKENP